MQIQKAILVCYLKKQWVSESSDGEAQWAEQWKNSPFWALQIEKELNPTAERCWAAFVLTVSSVLELRGSGSQNVSSDLSLSLREESFPVAERGGAPRDSANTPHIHTHTHTHTHTHAAGSAVISLTLIIPQLRLHECDVYTTQEYGFGTRPVVP